MFCRHSLIQFLVKWNCVCAVLAISPSLQAQPSTTIEYVYVNGRIVALDRGVFSISIQSSVPSVISLVPGGAPQTSTITIARTNYSGSVAMVLGPLPTGVSDSITSPLIGNVG